MTLETGVTVCLCTHLAAVHVNKVGSCQHVGCTCAFLKIGKRAPKMPNTGKCENCGRILITDAYVLCWRCANEAIGFPGNAFALTVYQSPDELEKLYWDIGGEG